MPGKRISSEVIQLVYYNHLIGKGVGEIKKMFGLQRQTVYNIINRAKNEKRLQLKFASGRPRKLTAATESLVISKVNENPYMSVRNLTKLLKLECGVIVSHETLRQTMNRNKSTSSGVRDNTNVSFEEYKMELNAKDTEELIQLVYSRPVLWDQQNKNDNNAVLIEENWQSVAEALKQPKELCRIEWQNACRQFGKELKKIPMPLLSQKVELSEAEYEPFITWPYFKSLLFLKNDMMAQTPAEYFSVVDVFRDTSNEVLFDDSFSESDEDIPDLEETVAQPVRKKRKNNLDCAPEILANKQRKLELLKNKIDNQNGQQEDDNSFFASLIPYMKTMDMNQNMLCRMELQRIVYNYSMPADTRIPEVSQNSAIQMDCFAEDTKVNIVDMTGEPKYSQN